MKRQPHGFIRVSPLLLDPPTQRLIFSLGGSIRDSGLIQCETKKIHDKIVELLDAKHIEMKFEEKFKEDGKEMPPSFLKRMKEFNSRRPPVVYDGPSIFAESQNGEARRLRQWFSGGPENV